MPSDHMHGIPAGQLLRWILRDLEEGSVFGLVEPLFFVPRKNDPFTLERYGVTLETPIGVAAGPHTQMAQNLITAWFAGARYMELKTVQELDAIQVNKPCIDIADEGYNCEWSQELSLDKSYREYLKAWVLIHVLHEHRGLRAITGKGPGLIFNMSAGYSMQGILSDKMQRFFARMEDCSADVATLKEQLAPMYPAIKDIAIPGRMCDSLTISCMHGCPPDEVERISLYFIEKRGYHTTLKMNPTLLGPEQVRGILNDTLGYDVTVPELAFAHDLPYADALSILHACRAAAEKKGTHFAVKLTNTLEALNTRQTLPASEKMVYLSGRPLHPISISLAARLQQEFAGDLSVSFCAGVEAFNVVETIGCGLSPVTICSDLLKPGGYGRLAQYVHNMREAFVDCGADSIDAFVKKQGGAEALPEAVQHSLHRYAQTITASDSPYSKAAGKSPNVKNSRILPALDCAAAPCMASCPTSQQIPAYLARVAVHDFTGALEVVLASNPFPHTLGKLCNQACRSQCMRTLYYEEPLKIRDCKKMAAEAAQTTGTGWGGLVQKPAQTGKKAVVFGADASGLACAYYLGKAGCAVTLMEATDKPGGELLKKMRREADRIERDIFSILSLGVDTRFGQSISPQAILSAQENADAVFVTLEAQTALPPFSLNNALTGAAFTILQELPPDKTAFSLVEHAGEGQRTAASLLFSMGLPRMELAHTGVAPRTLTDQGITALRVKQAFRSEHTGKLPEGDPMAHAREAARCLQCDAYCGICLSVCPNRAYRLVASPIKTWKRQKLVVEAGNVQIVDLGEETLVQPWQIVNIGDFCNECGNCIPFCPSAGAPYRAKWRIHYTHHSYMADDNGFILRDGSCVEGKADGRTWQVRKEGENLLYFDNTMTIILDAENLGVKRALLRSLEVKEVLLEKVTRAAFSYLIALS